jgi:amidase
MTAALPTATALQQMLRSREISAVEVLDQHLARIEQYNPPLNAIVTFTIDSARQKAREADDAAARGEWLGPLHGLPVAHKDLQCTRGVRTTFGSPIFKDYVPDFDTETVRRMSAAGAISIGKTNTPEFGAGSQTFNPVFGKTRNPYDPSKTCGGSSGGAAVALATGMVALADGSDTGGSLRNPASFCGITGLRTTPGLVPVSPNAVPESPLSVNGPLARNCQDAALLLEVIGDVPDHGPLERDFHGIRIAWCGEIPGMPFDPALRRAVEPMRHRLEEMGCIVDDAQPGFDGANEAFRILRAYEFFKNIGRLLPEHRERIKATVIEEIERGLSLTPADLERAHSLRDALIARLRLFQNTYPFFVLPTVQVLPFDIDQPFVTEIAGQPLQSYIDWMRSCYYVSILGIPALSLPAGRTPEGLPVGLQICGRAGSDWEVLQFGHAVEMTE